MKKILFILFILFILVLINSHAYDFIPYNNINGTNTYQIYDFTNITARDYICVDGTCYDSFAGSGTVTSVGTDNIYLLGGEITSSGTISLNESKLNSTIDLRSGGSSSDTKWLLDNIYLNNVSDTLTFNETLLNTTIDDRSINSVSWGDVTGKPFTGIDTTQGLRIVSNILSVDHTYLDNLYDQTSDINNIESDIDSNRSLWEQDTTYTASGTLLDLTGTEFSVNEGTLNNNQWCKYTSGTGIECNVAPVTDTNSYVDSISITGTNTKTITLGRNNLGDLSDTFTDIDTTYTNASPITLTGTEFGLINCPDTQGLFYNTTYGGWECQPKTSGGGGGTVTSVSGDGDYVLGTITDSGSFDFNETRLNSTIDLRDNYTESIDFTGTSTKTLTLTMANGNTVSDTFTDIDTTYTAGNGISLATTTFSVAGNTCLDADSDGLSVTDNCIGNTQLEFDTGQSLTTTSTPTFASLSTGQGQNELYAMNQDVETTDAVTFATINTGNGDFELYEMNQDVTSFDDVTFATINTGNGATEIYDMNQDVRSNDAVTFANVTIGGTTIYHNGSGLCLGSC